jgi:hypothetical protein
MTKKFAEKVLQYLGLKIANRMANEQILLNDMQAEKLILSESYDVQTI